MAEKKTRRIQVDASKLPHDLDSEELRELLGIAPDIWEDMADAQKMLLLAKRGIAAAQAALDGEDDE